MFTQPAMGKFGVVYSAQPQSVNKSYNQIGHQLSAMNGLLIRTTGLRSPAGAKDQSLFVAMFSMEIFISEETVISHMDFDNARNQYWPTT